MIKLAFYGKGGIGKSTAASNVSAALAQKGLKVMQIGCDPKADSTIFLHGGERIPTVLDLVRKGESFDLEDMVRVGYNGVVCVEAGGVSNTSNSSSSSFSISSSVNTLTLPV